MSDHGMVDYQVEGTAAFATQRDVVSLIVLLALR